MFALWLYCGAADTVSDARRRRRSLASLAHRQRFIMRAAHIRIKLWPRHEAAGDKLLKPTAVDGFAGVERTLGIDCDHVEKREFTGVMARASESAKNTPALAIKNPQDLVAGVDNVHVFLLWIGRKGDV